MDAPLADQAILAVRPFAGYRALRTRWESVPALHLGRAAARAALFQLFAIGVFVSLTAAGRLVAIHVASVMLFWSFGPALQALAVVPVARMGAPREAPARVLALYYAGQGPWMVFLTVIAGVPVIAPGLVVVANIGHLFRGFFVLLGLSVVWGGVLTYAFFREGLALPRRRAAAGTALFYATYIALIVAYYLVMNQIQPQLFGTA